MLEVSCQAVPRSPSRALGGAGAAQSGSTGGACAGLPGHCVAVCQGGACDCHCDCRGDYECGGAPGEFTCVRPGEPVPECCPRGPQCDASAAESGCSADKICSGGPCARCVPRCTDDAGCGEGYRCDSSGLCVFERCDTDGFACPARSMCAANQPGTDVHGCLHDLCEFDSECRGALCLTGRCYPSPGRCVPSCK